MRNLLSSSLVIAAVAALLVIAPMASAQGVVASQINLSPESKVAGSLKPGDTSTATIGVELCYAQGGFNPSGDSFTLDVALGSAPSWATITIVDSQVTFTPASTPAAANACEDGDPADIQIDATVNAGAPNGTTESFTLTFTVGGPDQAGTILKPSAPSDVSIDIELAAIESSGIPNPGDADGETPGTTPAADKPKESPAPVPALFVATTLAVAAVLRRRD